MPAVHKSKPHKGLQKRVKITATGKVLHKTAGNRHLATTKNGKQRRNLRQVRVLNNPAIAATFAEALCVYKPTRQIPQLRDQICKLRRLELQDLALRKAAVAQAGPPKVEIVPVTPTGQTNPATTTPTA